MTNLRKYSIIRSAAATICTLHVLQYSIKYWAPVDSPADLEEFSGLYGPGPYYAWLLAMLSAVCTQYYRSEEQRRLFSADLLSASAYIVVSITDMVRRDGQQNGVDDFQAQAAFHVVYVASWCSFIFSLFTRSNIWVNFLYGTSTVLFTSRQSNVLTACSFDNVGCIVMAAYVTTVSPLIFFLHGSAFNS
jgi:hypothetical protein